MKSDIKNRKEIENLVLSFYEKVHQDPLLSPIFEMPETEWERHITRVVNFWEKRSAAHWLFQTGSYVGGMMFVHIQADKKHGLTTEKFENWLSFWFMTVDELFEGENANFVKNKALELGQIMNGKFN